MLTPISPAWLCDAHSVNGSSREPIMICVMSFFLIIFSPLRQTGIVKEKNFWLHFWLHQVENAVNELSCANILK
jgi:hypothetical protein